MSQVNAVTGDLATFRSAYEQLLTVVQRVTPGTDSELFILDRLRQIDERLGDRAAALMRIEAQLELVETRSGPMSSRLCQPLWTAIPIFAAAGDHDRAIAAATRCAGLTPVGRASLTRASALNNLAVARHRAGRRQEALAAYEESAAIFATGSTTNHMRQENTLARVHANLGLLQWELKNPAQAFRHMQVALVQLNREAANLHSERGVVDSMATLSVEIDVLLSLERAAAP
jgi:tetratricopeptide (TPR) repeat protein